MMNNTVMARGEISRRDFVRLALITGVSTGFAPRAWAADSTQEIPRRTLGRTGEKVSALGLGGFHIGKQAEGKESIRIIRTAIDRGINFMDNSWDYNHGQSEIRMGKALRDGYRDKVFLMTKVDGRTAATATAQIDESLRRLQTDHLDLLQIHEVIRMEDPDRVFAPGGAMESILKAREAGKTRYLGFTGHKDPAIHLRMLETARQHGFHFDTVQMPLNIMDAQFRSFQKEVMPVALQEGIAVLGMKPMGSGIILQSKTVSAIECLHYALNLPASVIITGIDSMEILDQAIRAATTFRPLDGSEVAGLLSRTREAALSGRFEKFKTNVMFDSTAQHPQWLG